MTKGKTLVAIAMISNFAGGSAQNLEHVPDPTASSRTAPEDPNSLSSYQRHGGRDAIARMSLSGKLLGKLDIVNFGLRVKLAPGDAALLGSYAAIDEQHLQDIRAALRTDKNRICSTRRGKNAPQLEREFTAGLKKIDQESTAYYQQILDGLSPSGRSAVLEYMETSLYSAKATKLDVDTAAFAQARPKLALGRFEEVCSLPDALATPMPTTARNPDDPVGTIVR